MKYAVSTPRAILHDATPCRPTPSGGAGADFSNQTTRKRHSRDDTGSPVGDFPRSGGEQMNPIDRSLAPALVMTAALLFASPLWAAQAKAKAARDGEPEAVKNASAEDLPERLDKEPKLLESITAHKKALEVLAQHPRLDEIAEDHPHVLKEIATHPKAAEFLVQHPRLEYILAYNSGGLEATLANHPYLAQTLARHPELEAVVELNPDLVRAMAEHPGASKALAEHPGFAAMAERHPGHLEWFLKCRPEFKLPELTMKCWREAEEALRTVREERFLALATEHAGLAYAVCHHPLAALHLASHPRLAEIAAKHPWLTAHIAAHPEAARVLANHIHMDKLLASDPRGFEHAVATHPELAEKLASHPRLADIVKDHPALVRHIAHHPAAAKALSEHRDFTRIAAAHPHLDREIARHGRK